jgi:hypothetical protein
MADDLVAARPAQDCGSGDGQHDRQGVASPLGSARVRILGEERRQRTRVLGTEHQLLDSVVVVGIEDGLG